MPTSVLPPRVLAILEEPAWRGRWLDTRAIAGALFATPQVDESQVWRVRRALARLERERKVVRTGLLLEWRSAAFPQVEEPSACREMRQRLREAGYRV
jgi:hypothetical protein